VRDFVETHNRVADVDSYLSIVDFWMVPMQLIDNVSQLFELHSHSSFNVNIPSDYVLGLPAGYALDRAGARKTLVVTKSLLNSKPGQ